MAAPPILMLVTEPHENLVQIVGEAVAGGVSVVQLRDKRSDLRLLMEQARRIRELSRGRATLLLNGFGQGDVREIGPEGVHLPERGVAVEVVRPWLRAGGMVGRSVHSLDSARSAEAGGADYVVAGTIFASRSHPGLAPAGPDFLRRVCEGAHVPVIAIGGVTPENVADCLRVGACGVAVLSPIMRATDPRAVAAAYRRALEERAG